MNNEILIEIFDPPMCCPGGLCGPVIDPALLDVQEAVLKLKSEHGVTVRRYLLQQQGAKFVQNPESSGASEGAQYGGASGDDGQRPGSENEEISHL